MPFALDRLAKPSIPNATPLVALEFPRTLAEKSVVIPHHPKRKRHAASAGALVKTGLGPIRNEDSRPGAHFRSVAKSDVVIREQRATHGCQREFSDQQRPPAAQPNFASVAGRGFIACLRQSAAAMGCMPHGASPSRIKGSSASLKGESSCRHKRSLHHRRKPLFSTPLR